LIVDRSVECTDGCIVVARLHDEFIRKRILKKETACFSSQKTRIFSLSK
jgi:SOS-response transcriptional repressor LexA